VVVGCIYAQAIMDGPLWLPGWRCRVHRGGRYRFFSMATMRESGPTFGVRPDARSIADKLLVASCLLMLAADGIIHGWTLWDRDRDLCRGPGVGIAEHIPTAIRAQDHVAAHQCPAVDDAVRGQHQQAGGTRSLSRSDRASGRTPNVGPDSRIVAIEKIG